MGSGLCLEGLPRPALAGAYPVDMVDMVDMVEMVEMVEMVWPLDQGCNHPTGVPRGLEGVDLVALGRFREVTLLREATLSREVLLRGRLPGLGCLWAWPSRFCLSHLFPSRQGRFGKWQAELWHPLLLYLERRDRERDRHPRCR